MFLRTIRLIRVTSAKSASGLPIGFSFSLHPITRWPDHPILHFFLFINRIHRHLHAIACDILCLRAN
jgi:hypothetical protein